MFDTFARFGFGNGERPLPHARRAHLLTPLPRRNGQVTAGRPTHSERSRPTRSQPIADEMIGCPGRFAVSADTARSASGPCNATVFNPRLVLEFEIFVGNTCRLVETFNTMRAPLRSLIEPPRRMRHTGLGNTDDQNDRRSFP
jgi:hypothetical protein